MVAQLKKQIKTEKQPDLNLIATNNLTLYLTTATLADKPKRHNELNQQSQNLDQCLELDEEATLSEYFSEKAPPGRAYYILVQRPKSESIYKGVWWRILIRRGAACAHVLAIRSRTA